MLYIMVGKKLYFKYHLIILFNKILNKILLMNIYYINRNKQFFYIYFIYIYMIIFIKYFNIILIVIFIIFFL